MAYAPKSQERIERSVPERAARAVKAAYKQSINAGHVVLIIANSTLYRVQPDLTRTAIRKVPKRFKIPKGTRYKLK